MAITERQRQARTQGIGASEAAAILGLNPYRSAGDILARKVGLVEDDGPSEAAEVGLALEPAIADLTAKRMGRKLVSPTATFPHPKGLPLFANPDRFVEKCERGRPVVEIKYTGQTEGWGEPGTDEVPDNVLVQVQAQMVCVGCTEAHVGVLKTAFGRSRLDLYRIAPNTELQKIIEDRLAEWWDRYVVQRAPLAETAPGLETLGRIKRTPGKSIIIATDLVQAWRDAEADFKAAEERRDLAKAAVRAVIAQEQAESATCEIGAISDKMQSRARLDTERLRAEQPEIVAKYQRTTTFPVMRFTPAKRPALEAASA